ncbi:MAG TPA: branched-chain amino acid transport system II carrier protein [Rectinema sp.]|jgi:LIVCS family branched-chain amino acid:cation transporter|nr:branched-chain amino acid transport system II carrier protein [Rectinema sp.]
MDTEKKLSLPFSVILVISAAVFSGHFGVGDTIFPAILGRSTGSQWLVAAIGYGIINSLMVLLAYLAISRQNASLYGLTSKIFGKGFATAYTVIAVLIMGPVFILPRVSSATHEMAVVQFFPSIPIWLTLLIYFVLNFYFAYNRSKVIDKLGKYLAPALIVFMIILVIKGILTPLSSVPSTGSPSAFSDGILNGYNTMNALGALIFGIWIINELKRRGIEDEKSRSFNIATIGIFASIALFLTSLGLTYLGASSGSLFPEAQIGDLSVKIAEGLLGSFGKLVFALIIALACFTTSVGLTSAAGDTFEQMSGGKIHYKITVAASSVIGFLLGLIGLSKIVGYTVPWLMLIYPATVVVIIMSLFSDFSKVKLATQAGVVIAIFFSVGDFLAGLGFPNTPFSTLNAAMPLGKQGLAWLTPSVAAIVIFQIIVMIRKPKSEGQQKTK